MNEQIRHCIFKPYGKGEGPIFHLYLYDTGRADSMGKCILGYRLTARKNGATDTIFEGEDFACSPIHAIDSDDTVASLMNFLTLRPGDTDSDYFANYTAEQLAFCEHHAEHLGLEVYDRFGER
jgi:hypothetical protein